MYDLIVIGDDLSSHVAAAAAGRHGLTTLLVAEAGTGGLKVAGDFVFNVDPAPATGLGPGQTAGNILAELGISLPEDHADPLSPAYQVILPGHRLDFFSDPGELAAEMTREFPHLKDAINDYYRAAAAAGRVFADWLDKHTGLQPRTLKDFLSYLKIFPDILRYKFAAAKFDGILSHDTSLDRVWEAQQALLCFNHHDLFSFSSAFQYCAPRRGVFYFSEGKQFLFNALIGKLEENKGVYLGAHEVLSISAQETIDMEIREKNGAASKVSGKNLIISTKAESLGLLKKVNRPQALSGRFRPAEAVRHPFTVFMGVASKCLPAKLTRHAAVVTDINKDLHDENLIILETGLPSNQRDLSTAESSVSATVYLENAEEKWTTDALRREGTSVVDRLEWFLPFLKDNIKWFDVDKSIEISLERRKVATPVYNIRNSFFTSFAAKNGKTKLSNVFLTGASLLTDAGFDAEIISGKNAAQHIIRKRK
ncbi:MAG: hypothetical protein GX155_03070 [Smithella sp.]|nr:hypothetical protein [Smithella sp.]